MKKDKTVDRFFEKQVKWKDEINLLRTIFLKTELEETLKWGMPTYCLKGKNVAGIGAFKNHFGIWFFNGALLSDKKGLLTNAQEKTKAMRQLKFNSKEELNEKTILEYILEAIKNQKEGKVVNFEAKKKIDIPNYLVEGLNANKAALDFFNNFSDAKKREYIEWLNEAKTEATKIKRLATAIEWISEGKPKNWKYMKKWK